MLGPLDSTSTGADIMSVLPHRYPFLLIDKILSVHRNPPGSPNQIGEKIVAIKNVTFNEPQFQGHFPGNPVMPGVLMIEAMAQAAGLLAHRPHPTGGRWNFHLAGVDGAKFRRLVQPGDVLEIHCQLLRQKSGFYVFRGEGFVSGERAVEAEIMARMF